MISWAFIFEAPETDPKADRMVIERGGLKTTIVAVPEASGVVRAARELAEEGVQFIELCGAFGPVWAGKVADATGIPVGSVGYSGEAALARMAGIFGQTA